MSDEWKHIEGLSCELADLAEQGDHRPLLPAEAAILDAEIWRIADQIRQAKATDEPEPKQPKASNRKLLKFVELLLAIDRDG